LDWVDTVPAALYLHIRERLVFGLPVELPRSWLQRGATLSTS
jgi:hypothetical protein